MTALQDFIQPEYAIQGQSGINNFVVLFVDLCPVDIEDNRQNEDKRPVEVLRTADSDGIHQIHGLLRTVTPKSEHCNPSFYSINDSSDVDYTRHLQAL